MVVVAIQSADGRNLFGAFQLSTLETIFTTGVGLQGQTDVRPQLTLGAKAMWCLYECHQQCGTDGTDRRNLPQQLHCGVLAAFCQQFAPRLPTQRSSPVKLPMIEFPPPAHPGLVQLRQPFRAMTQGVDLLAGTGNGPTSIDRFDASHRPREISSNRQVAACQFLQGSQAMLAVI